MDRAQCVNEESPLVVVGLNHLWTENVHSIRYLHHARVDDLGSDLPVAVTEQKVVRCITPGLRLRGEGDNPLEHCAQVRSIARSWAHA